VWLLSVCQTPWVFGETGGRLAPSALAIGLENVSMIGVPGLIGVPGAGSATAVAAAPAGNQLTSRAPELSQERVTAETKMLPATALCGSGTTLLGAARTWRWRWPAGPYA
jgi:hypothetical protein